MKQQHPDLVNMKDFNIRQAANKPVHLEYSGNRKTSLQSLNVLDHNTLPH